MSVIANNIVAGAAGQGGADAAYEISRSVRLNSADSAHFSRTPSSAGNRKTWTWSGWIKRSDISASKTIWASSTLSSIRFATNSEIEWLYEGSYGLKTNAVFRDTSAWYHFVFVLDTTNATADDRQKIYVNGTQLTSFASRGNPSLNSDKQWNAASVHAIGAKTDGSVEFDGYLADVHFIDGQALTADDFGEPDADTGVWNPIEYTGSYGTNGFHLDFSDNSTAAALGTDTSGNSNTWTVNNLSVASGAGNDSLIDTPTNYEASSGNNGGNYCTWNPLAREASRFTFANGNLNVSGNAQNYGVSGTLFVGGSGKYYFELTSNSSVTYPVIGIVSAEAVANDMVDGSLANGLELGGPVYGFVPGYGPSIVTQTTTNTWSGVSQSTPTSGDVYGVAVDFDNGAIYFSKNGTFLNSGDPTSGSTKTGAAFTSISAGNYTVLLHDWGSSDNIDFDLNAGQRSFSYTPPTGYKSLCTTNLPDPTIADGSTAMDVALYTGNGSTQTISGLGFSPDLVWLKSRSQAYYHILVDSVRGNTKELYSNDTTAEQTTVNTVTAFTSDGFSLGNRANTNQSSATYVGWTWDGGTSTVTNTNGSITSQVRANASAGFSIVTYTTPATNTFTVGHGLGAAPSLILVKGRNQTYSWDVYHSSLGATRRLMLDLSSAFETRSGPWANTSPTSTVFSSSGNGVWYNTGDTLVAYCFAPVSGFSAFGSWVGSSSGSFNYTGFKPKFILFKESTNTGNWQILDSERNTYNARVDVLFPNLANAETDSPAGSRAIDFLSNGFMTRGTDSDINTPGETYVWAAFAESPFKYSRAA